MALVLEAMVGNNLEAHRVSMHFPLVLDLPPMHMHQGEPATAQVFQAVRSTAERLKLPLAQPATGLLLQAHQMARRLTVEQIIVAPGMVVPILLHFFLLAWEAFQ